MRGSGWIVSEYYTKVLMDSMIRDGILMNEICCSLGGRSKLKNSTLFALEDILNIEHHLFIESKSNHRE